MRTPRHRRKALLTIAATGGLLSTVVIAGPVDAVPGDGVCQDAVGSPGACSLRAAIDEARRGRCGERFFEWRDTARPKVLNE